MLTRHHRILSIVNTVLRHQLTLRGYTEHFTLEPAPNWLRCRVVFAGGKAYDVELYGCYNEYQVVSRLFQDLCYFLEPLDTQGDAMLYFVAGL